MEEENDSLIDALIEYGPTTALGAAAFGLPGRAYGRWVAKSLGGTKRDIGKGGRAVGIPMGAAGGVIGLATAEGSLPRAANEGELRQLYRQLENTTDPVERQYIEAKIREKEAYINEAYGSE